MADMRGLEPWRLRGRRLAPGLYAHEGTLHVDAVELCEHFGVPPTEASQETAARVAAKVAEGAGVPWDREEHG